MNGVYPEEIYVGENNLTFKVQYTHILGTPPLKTQIWIDLNTDGDFSDPGEKVDMREADLLDTDYTNGKNFYANVTINSDGINKIRYRFVFTDENEVEAIGTPSFVASLSTIQAEEKNVCFIQTAEKQTPISRVKCFLREIPLFSSIFTSFSEEKLVLNFSF
jgi:hypothetical protein